MSPPIAVVVEFVFKPEALVQARGVMNKLVKDSLTEYGCLQFQLYQDPANSNRLLLIEAWENKACWDVHLNRSHVKTCLVALKPILQASFKPSWYYLVSDASLVME
jgi:quinol monooxygenase YgiN